MAHPPHVPMKGRDRAQLILLSAALIIVVVGAILVLQFLRKRAGSRWSRAA